MPDAADPFMIDDENPEWTEADFAAARPAREVLGDDFVDAHERNPGGRPRGSNKQMVTLRLDRDVVDRFKAAGPGWQSRMNQKLREVMP